MPTTTPRASEAEPLKWFRWKRWRYRSLVFLMIAILLWLGGSIALQYRQNIAVERLANRYGGHVNFEASPTVFGISLEAIPFPDPLEYHVIRAFDEIDNLSLSGSPDISPHELAPLAGIGGTSAVLHVTTFDDTHCNYLGRNRTQALWLESRNLSDEGFRKIRANESLRFLSLTNMEVDLGIAKEVAEYPNLRSLYLWGRSEITPDALLELGSAGLENLRLPKGIADQHVSSLLNWKDLKLLVLSGWTLPEETMTRLVEELPHLERIEVNGPHELSKSYLEKTFGGGPIKIFFLPGWE